MKWTHEQIEKLIDLYRQKPVLWDPKNEDYRIKKKKNDAWRSIAGFMGCKVSRLRTKMASLLTSFRKERAKEKRATGQGGGKAKSFESSWFAFKLFEFLKAKDSNTENVSDGEGSQDCPPVTDGESQWQNVDRSSSENPQSRASRSESPPSGGDEDSVRGGITDPPEQQSRKSPEDPSHLSTDGDWLRRPMNPSSSENPESRASRNKPPSRSDEGNAFRETLASLEKRSRKRKKREDPRLTQAYNNFLDRVFRSSRDECSTFGKHMAAKLRKFEDPERATLMYKFNNMMFEAETKLFSNLEQHHGNSDSSSLSRMPTIL